MNITKENCLEIVNGTKNRHTGDVDIQAESWKLIYNLCLQLGMDNRDGRQLSGLERVVEFIISKHKAQ